MRYIMKKLLLIIIFLSSSLFARDDDETRKAYNATEALKAKYSKPGIKPKRFFQAAYYIEKHLKKIKHSSRSYLTKKQTGLRHAIEYDPKSDHIFIVLNAKKAFIGSGAKKKVYKAILYGEHPKVVARGEQAIPMEDELYAHRALNGAAGVMATHAYTRHKDKKNTYHTIYADLYEGPLANLFRNKNLSLWNRLIVMSDLLNGLNSLHSRNFVHRDLHAYNFLVHKESSGTYRAVIADLGRTLKINKVKAMPAQMMRKMCAPEGFAFKKLKGKDYFATDIYALGCIFYNLFHNKLPSWQTESLRSDHITRAGKRPWFAKT